MNKCCGMLMKIGGDIMAFNLVGDMSLIVVLSLFKIR